MLDLRFEDLAIAIADGNTARLCCLGNLADEIDVQKAVFKRRARYVHVVGELEAAFERAARNALIKDFALGCALVAALFRSADREDVFLLLDGEIGFAKAATATVMR